MTLRTAAVVAGFGYLLGPVAYAEFTIMPKLVIPGDIARTVENLVSRKGMFVGAILCYLISFLLDIVVAWALYVLLAPVNRALSLLAAWFRLVYTAVVLVALMNLVHVYGLLNQPDNLNALGSEQLHVQAKLGLDAFRSDWSLSLVIFGVHLVLIGWLIFRSWYVPKFIGILLVIDGLGWEIDSLRPYLYPNAALSWLSITFFGELLFMVWLLIWGWRIKDPVRDPVAGA
jgi:Domain of unknown function (DUF4386)